MICVNGVEFVFSPFDAADMRAFFAAEENVRRVWKKIAARGGKNMKKAAYLALLEEACGVVLAFFEAVGGEGCANRVFGPKAGLGDCLQAFFAFGDEVQRKAAEESAHWQRYVQGKSKVTGEGAVGASTAGAGDLA